MDTCASLLSALRRMSFEVYWLLYHSSLCDLKKWQNIRQKTYPFREKLTNRNLLIFYKFKFLSTKNSARSVNYSKQNQIVLCLLVERKKVPISLHTHTHPRTLSLPLPDTHKLYSRVQWKHSWSTSVFVRRPQSTEVKKKSEKFKMWNKSSLRRKWVWSYQVCPWLVIQ